jgi:hypothetical protein
VDAGSTDITLTVTGSGFTPQSAVQLNGTLLATTFVSPTQLTAVAPAAQLTTAGSFPVTVVTPSPGGGTSNTTNLTIVVVVTVSPATQTLNVTQTQPFTATVTGTSNTAVTWSVNDVVGGDSTVGTISASGLYTAPATVPNPATVTVKATSQADTSKSASATLTVNQPPAITSANSTTFTVGTAGSFTVTATGFPAPRLSETGTLPSGVTFTDNGDGTATLSGTAAAGTVGTYSLTLTAHNGIGSDATQNFTLNVNNPAPVLSSISPKAATVDDWDVTVWLMGSDFAAQSVAYADTTALATVFVSSTTLSATIPNDPMLLAPGTLTITVVTPPPGGGTTLPGATFTICAKNYPRTDGTSVLRTSPALSAIVPISGKSVVAVLDWATDVVHKHPDDTEEDDLAVCHVLAPSGIPHVHVTSVPDPAVYPFLAVAGTLEFSGQLTNPERDALQAYVQNGGTLFLWLPSDSGLLSPSRLNLTVAYTHTDPSSTFRRPLTFVLTTGDHALSYIDYNAQGETGEEAEVNWRMIYPPGASFPTLGYDASSGAGQVLATWDDGGAALVRRDLGTGRAYVFGWRLRLILTQAEREILADESERPPWTDTPRLGADICRLLVRGAYEGWAGTNAQIRGFAPEGKKAALIVTHDVDDATSYEQMPVFAQYESSQGITATYNLTTSPYDNGEEAGFYNASGIQDAKDALALGHDIESHSFGHFWDFGVAGRAPYSLTPAETAANYEPEDLCYGESPTTACTTGLSVLGEEGVSRWLLESDLSITVEGFRSGYLAIPARFFEGLSNTGYRRDSSYASGATRGSFPFVAFEAPGGAVTTHPITEYPIALSDDELTDTNLEQVLDKWENVIRVNYNNHAPTVLLIHTALPGPRLAAEQGIIQRVADLTDLWIGDWKTFAEFWEAQGVTCERWP